MDDLSQIPTLTRRVAQLRADGASPKQVRGPTYTRPYHGLRRLDGAELDGLDLDGPALRIADAIGLMTPGCVLTGWAARWIQRQAFCDGISYGEELPVTILCGPGSDVRTRSGIRPSDRRYLPGEVLDIGDFATATLARATYDDMLSAPNPLEALVTVEMATSTTIEQPRAAPENVRAVFDAHVKTRGRKQARWALGQASTRSASPWETRTRILAIDAVGVQHWLINVPIFDLREHLLGIADLIDPETGLVIESDGSDHRRIARHNDDNVRNGVFEDHRMPVVRIGAAQHARAERANTVERIINGRARADRRGPHLWTTEKPAWWWDWPPGRRWD